MVYRCITVYSMKGALICVKSVGRTRSRVLAFARVARAPFARASLEVVAHRARARDARGGVTTITREVFYASLAISARVEGVDGARDGGVWVGHRAQRRRRARARDAFVVASGGGARTRSVWRESGALVDVDSVLTV